jgi:hypothetical protein
MPSLYSHLHLPILIIWQFYFNESLAPLQFSSFSERTFSPQSCSDSHSTPPKYYSCRAIMPLLFSRSNSSGHPRLPCKYPGKRRRTKEQTYLRVYGVRSWLRRKQLSFDSILAGVDCGWGWSLWNLLDCWLKKRLRRRSNCKEKKYSRVLFLNWVSS